ncbi:ABC-F family ATP-binding cassette domain-containing protein [soil metagenome]
MILASLQQVEKWYGEQTVLDGVTLELRPEERLALIGRNGAGKSTVLRLLARSEVADGGTVYVRPGVSVGVLDQAPTFESGATVGRVADESFAELDALEGQLVALEARGLDDPETYERWEDLHGVFERRGGYVRRARRDAVLHALGFAGREGDPARALSGGEVTRLGLAQLLMSQPDVALLDEPTNHLDLRMRTWLEGFLRSYPGAVVLVSHDRAFLDAACDRTAEVTRGELRVRPLAPTAYREADAERRRIDAATRANQEREHARLEAAALQMKRWAGQNEKLARRFKAMERRAERYESEMVEELAGPEGTTRFAFPAPPSVEIALIARHLSASYGETLFRDVQLTLRRHDRAVLVGPNGAGKTTLLRIVTGERPSDDPRASIEWGARVRVAYYDQTLSRFDPEATLVETLIRLVGDRRAHDLLGRFMFPFEAQYKQVKDLSGGERARLALLELTLSEANVLVLDEPTNHLDLEMIEALEAALEAYEGTLLVVSHDRRLLSRLATRVWEIEGGTFEEYEGDWAFYERKRRERRGEASPPMAVAPGRARGQGVAGSRADDGDDASDGRDGRSTWRLERDQVASEGEVARLEGVLEAAQLEVEGAAADPDADHVRLAEVGERFERLERELLEAMARGTSLDELLRRRRDA